MIKIEREEDRQLPRWVYALMASKSDATDAELFNDSPKLRGENQVKAQNFHKQRMERLKEQERQSDRLNETSRTTGLEWKMRPKTTFTSEELDKILPTRRLSYVIKRVVFFIVISVAVAVPTCATAFCIAAVCAEIKLHGSFDQALQMFTDSPSAYYTRVHDALTTDGTN